MGVSSSIIACPELLVGKLVVSGIEPATLRSLSSVCCCRDLARLVVLSVGYFQYTWSLQMYRESSTSRCQLEPACCESWRYLVVVVVVDVALVT